MADSFVVERTTRISAAPTAVFAHVGDLQKWDDWSPWAAMDPNMAKTYSGETGAVGQHYHWTGNRKVGEGEMTISDIDAPNRVVIDLAFIKPFKSKNVTELMVAPDGDGSEVTWRMTGPHTLMTKFMGIFRSMDKMVGPDFEKGLASLKQLAEG